MNGHCFISYSTADALEFATKLANELESGNPLIPVWFDKNNLKPGADWDVQIDDGLKACRMVLFIMTKDSVNEKSVCKQEWSRALSYKKPIIPIWLHNDILVPFRIQDRQRIDFRKSFEAGIKNLREFIFWLDSPEGVLRAYKDRLADAERDIQRVDDDDKLRIQADIDELKNQIQVQERIVSDPEAAKKQTEQNIQNGLERERKPQLPVASFQSSKFINQPPGVAQIYFQDRTMETEQAILFLKNEAQRVLTVVGRGGAGKTAMVCRLLKFVENGGLPDDFERRHGRVDVDGIVYLSEAGSRKVNFANLFEDLCKLLPAASAEKLSALYREPQTSTESKTVQLLAAFQGLKQVIVLLDNFENVVDAEKGQVRDAELDEALRAILHAPHHPAKIIITTRVSARELDAFEPARQRLLPLDTGLQPEYAREAFVLMDEGKLVGIKNAGADLLNLAVTRTLGLPRALEALYAALRTDRFTTLQELLDLPILPEQVVQAYVGEAFNRLDTNAQKVMQALAVYNRPVTPAAVDYLLAPHLPAIDSAPILQRLANMHFARKESGRFYLHPVDREFAYSLIPKGEKILNSKKEQPIAQRIFFRKTRVDFTQYGLLDHAADYYAKARKSRTEWKNLDDLYAQLAEFDLRCIAGDYDTAAFIIQEFDAKYLLVWGHCRLMINLHESLEGKLQDKSLAMFSVARLGLGYHSVGKIEDFIKCEERALEIAKEIKDRANEGEWLGNLGNAYFDLGEANKAIEYYDQILNIFREVGSRNGEGTTYDNIGLAMLNLEKYQESEKIFQQSIQIADEILNPVMQQEARWGLAQAYLCQNHLTEAIITNQAALQYDVPEYNHNASALHGIIALRQGDEVTARGAFVRAIGQADEILSKTAEYYDALDAKGLAICGLILAGRGDPSMPTETNDGKIVPPDKSTVSAGRVAPTVDDAIETFRKARKIAPHAGVVKRVLRLFDELAKCDQDGLLKDVRNAAEGKE